MGYDSNDIVDYYFIMVTDRNGTRVQAWTEEKVLAEAYMEFHNCKHFKLKKMTNTLNNLYKIIEENLHDEIQLYNITIPKDSKHPGKTKTIVVPCTKSEINVINDDSVNFMATQVPYHEMDKISRWLRPKYQRALKGILFRDVCDQVLSIKSPSRILRNIDMNGLKVLIQSFPDSFG